jgi:hypothetical protein
MMKGGLPPFKKLNKEVIKINNTRTFQPNLLISNLLQKKETETEKEEESEEL